MPGGALSEQLLREGLTEKETSKLGIEQQEGQHCGNFAAEPLRGSRRHKSFHGGNEHTWWLNSREKDCVAGI